MSYLTAGHLGDLGAALVDDQLSPQARDLALSHLASCAECQRDVEQQRRLKARLRRLAEPELPFDLSRRLSALKTAPIGAAAPSRMDPPGGNAGPMISRPRDGRPLGRPTGAPSARRGRLLAGAASLLLIGVGTAYAASGEAQPTSPAGTTANVLSTGRAPTGATLVRMNDPAFAAMTASFTP